MIVLDVIVCSSQMFLFCFFGKIATDSYQKLSVSLYQSDWINSPIELQKYMILIMQNSQQPHIYHGFRIVYLDLETYVKVI